MIGPPRIRRHGIWDAFWGLVIMGSFGACVAGAILLAIARLPL